MRLPAEKKILLVLSEGKNILALSDIEPIYRSGVLQSEHIRTLLMHSCKMHPWKVNKGKMNSKNNFICSYAAVRRFHQMLLHFFHGSILINLQFLSQRSDKLQRMKFRLTVETHGACAGDWEGNLFLQYGIHAKLPGGFHFFG